jgi:hypothetical protein
MLKYRDGGDLTLEYYRMHYRMKGNQFDRYRNSSPDKIPMDTVNTIVDMYTFTQEAIRDMCEKLEIPMPEGGAKKLRDDVIRYLSGEDIPNPIHEIVNSSTRSS